MDKKLLLHFVDEFSKQEGSPYPCSNQNVVCGVVTPDKDKALRVMEEKGATLLLQGKSRLDWELNGEHWIWIRWNASQRGYRFYKVFIDENIDEELFYRVIVGCCGYCCYAEII